MPASATAAGRKAAILKAEQARRLLASGQAVAQEFESDSDDDDDGWEWIYEDGSSSRDALESESESSSKRKRRESTRATTPTRQIVEARRGKLSCKIADCISVQGVNAKLPWAAMVCGFREREFVDEEEQKRMMVDVVWFTKPSDIARTQKKTADFLPHETYITTDPDPIPLASIIGKASILSLPKFMKKYPKGEIPKSSKDLHREFVCRKGLQSRTITYTPEFIWEDMYQGTEDSMTRLLQFVDDETMAPKNDRKRKAGSAVKKSKKKPNYKEKFKVESDEDSEHENVHEYESESGSEAEEVETPRKRRKTTNHSTPRKPRTPSKFMTPSHKRVILKKPLEFTPLGTRVLSPNQLYASPFQTARSRLHVSSVPDALPCREDEFGSVYSHLESAISDGSGACIYISGTPGTGKTATVREVVAQLNQSVLNDELDPFIFVEINGMKVTDPHQSYSLLWQALSGERVSPAHALDLLEREFSHPSPRRQPCVVLMDELDQLVTKNQSVMYNFFNWPGLKHSKLVVLAVANTMDLPERTLSNKISSRLGLTRITFPGYTHEQLMKIIQSRLEGVPGNIVESDAVQFASRKVAAVSGDARRALDICRRAVELAEGDVLSADTVPPTPSKSAVRKASSLNPTVSKSLGKVTIATVKRAINEATTSPLQQYLRGLPLSSKLFLAALLVKTRRSGLAESVLGEVIDEARKMAKMDTGGNAIEHLMRNEIVYSRRGRIPEKMRHAPRVLSMGSSAIDLMEAGIIGLEVRRADRMGKIRLSIGEEDVKLAFRDDPEVKNLGFTA